MKIRKTSRFCTDIVGCARCGGDHEQVWFTRMKKPFTVYSVYHNTEYPFHGVCPATSEPLLAGGPMAGK